MAAILAHQGEFYALLCGVFWGMAVCLFRKSGEAMPPMSLNLFKNALGVVLFGVTMLAFGQRLIIDAPAIDYLLTILSGVIGMTVADNLFFASLNRIGAGVWAVVDCLYTPSVIVLAFTFLGESLDATDLVGAAIIIAAVLLASLDVRRLRAATKEHAAVGILQGVGGIVLMAVGGVMIKPVLARQPLLWVTQVRLVAGTLSLAVVMLLRRDRRRLFEGMWPKRGLRYAVLGTFFGTYLTALTWMAGMKFTLISIAAILNQLSVLFIFLFASVFLREPLTRRKVVAVVVAFLGVLLVVGV